jgi:hypothetical protein
MALPTLADLKAHVNVTTTTHDAELAAMLAAATNVVEAAVGPLVVRSVTETVTVRGGTAILSTPPATGVTSLTTGSGTTVDTFTLNGRAGLLTGLPVSGSVTVTYTAGRDVIPDALSLAVLVVASRLWETQRGNAPARSALPGADDAFTNPSGLPLLPPLAQALLDPYRLASPVG